MWVMMECHGKTVTTVQKTDEEKECTRAWMQERKERNDAEELCRLNSMWPRRRAAPRNENDFLIDFFSVVLNILLFFHFSFFVWIGYHDLLFVCVCVCAALNECSPVHKIYVAFDIFVGLSRSARPAIEIYFSLGSCNGISTLYTRYNVTTASLSCVCRTFHSCLFYLIIRVVRCVWMTVAVVVGVISECAVCCGHTHVVIVKHTHGPNHLHWSLILIWYAHHSIIYYFKRAHVCATETKPRMKYDWVHSYIPFCRWNVCIYLNLFLCLSNVRSEYNIVWKYARKRPEKWRFIDDDENFFLPPKKNPINSPFQFRLPRSIAFGPLRENDNEEKKVQLTIYHSPIKTAKPNSSVSSIPCLAKCKHVCVYTSRTRLFASTKK